MLESRNVGCKVLAAKCFDGGQVLFCTVGLSVRQFRRTFLVDAGWHVALCRAFCVAIDRLLVAKWCDGARIPCRLCAVSRWGALVTAA